MPSPAVSFPPPPRGQMRIGAEGQKRMPSPAASYPPSTWRQLFQGPEARSSTWARDCSRPPLLSCESTWGTMPPPLQCPSWLLLDIHVISYLLRFCMGLMSYLDLKDLGAGGGTLSEC